MPEHYYRLGGLVIKSARKLCHAQPITATDQVLDVNLSILESPPGPNDDWDILADWICGNRDQLLIGIPGVARFLVSHGRSIATYPLPGVAWEVVELYLLGTAMGVIYHQRGIHPLHAACVARDDAAIALAGDSGEGKTTLAYAMTRRGYELLTDDVVPLTREQNGYVAHREKPVFKISQATAAHFSLPVEGLAAINNLDSKYYLPAGDTQTNDCPLKVLVVLESDADCQAPELEKVPRLQTIACIRSHTYRSLLVPLLWGEEAFLKQSMQLAATIDVWRLTRPRSLQYLEATADAIDSL